jgi:outer membrane protein assembly factor BamB
VFIILFFVAGINAFFIHSVKEVFILSVFFSNQQVKEFSQWRGPQRNGIYQEKGLLKVWPERGPEMLWSFEGLGSGHGNVGFSKDKIFILGMPDTIGILYAFDFSGKLLWKKEYGEEWHLNYIGSRSTPTVVDGRVYFESGQGVVYCYNEQTGAKIWSVDLLKKYNAKNITWGMAESLLIEGNRIFCTPGGKDNNIVALDRFSGETIWTSPGNHQPAAYCSPIFIKHNKTPLIITMTAESIIGVDAESGILYWQVPQIQSNKIHANSPVYSNGRIFCSSESGKDNSGIAALKLSEDGKTVNVEWRNLEFSNLKGGIIVKDGFIYGSRYLKKSWCCLDASNGKIKYTSGIFGDGSVIWADNLFYCYSQEGEMALVDANPSAFLLISRYKIPLGSDQHWAHPVIHQGRLYIRHGNALMVYKIK